MTQGKKMEFKTNIKEKITLEPMKLQTTINERSKRYTMNERNNRNK